MTGHTRHGSNQLLSDDSTLSPVFWAAIGVAVVALLWAAILGPLFLEATGQ